MHRSSSVFLSLFVLVAAAGCATTNVTPDGSSAGVPRLPKPDRVIVHPFAATSADLPPEEQGNYAEPANAPSPEQIATGRELGNEVARQLVEEINDMGMHAVVGTNAEAPRVGDIVIEGHFESIDEGSAVKRMALGFGSGKAELNTVVVGYVMTNRGLRRVGGATVDSGGGKGPGLFIPLLVTAATANPIGLVVTGAAKIEGEASGRTTIKGAAKRTADAIAERMKTRFEQEGWI